MGTEPIEWVDVGTEPIGKVEVGTESFERVELGTESIERVDMGTYWVHAVWPMFLLQEYVLLNLCYRSPITKKIKIWPIMQEFWKV